MILKREEIADLWDKCLQSLQGLRDLSDDWDGEGSRRPEQGNVDAALAWVSSRRRRNDLPFAPAVMPGTNGEVSLIWRTEEEYLEAEITAPGRFEWMRIRKGHPAEFCTNQGEPPTRDDWAN